MSNSTIPLGPIYRIYPDPLQAFMSGVLPNGTSGRFLYANTNTLSTSGVGILVPSRLYSINSTASPSKPFNGLRVTVKDIIDIEGVKTSNGNRAWFELYAEVNETASAVKRVLGLGGVAVGKTKTAQFANADRVTADWVDYQFVSLFPSPQIFYDFPLKQRTNNLKRCLQPCGDGYQDTGVSSVGAGSATAGYNWVGVSICTDTGGSIRIPASKQGIYAIRPSFGTLPNDGVMLEGQYFDSVGFLPAPHTPFNHSVKPGL